MNIPPIPHPAFAKIPRLNRDIVITEKIDGTNALVHVTETGEVFAGSRNRWITPENDNYGFARWVEANSAELQKLGPGFHYGEYWGQGIQDGYGLKEKRFSLFNTGRWMPNLISGGVFEWNEDGQECNRVACCHVVPILYTGPLSAEEGCDDPVKFYLSKLRNGGSVAAPGYMKPEGIVVFHTASRKMYKVTLDNDNLPKSIKIDKALDEK